MSDKKKLDEQEELKSQEEQAQQEGSELLENPEALAEQIEKGEEFVSKNKGLLGGVLGVVILAVVGIYFFKGSASREEEKAQKAIYPIQYFFSQDSTNLVLNGSDSLGIAGVASVSSEHSGTKAANLAHYYAGVSYLKEGQSEKAIAELQQFSSDDLLLQGRVYALIGLAQLDLDQKDAAIASLQKAADYKPNAQFTPSYLFALAQAYEAKGDYASAASSYGKIVSKYKKSDLYNEARKMKARAEGLSN